MSAGNFVRVIAVLGAVLAAAGSATSSSNDSNKSMMAQNGQQQTPPPPQQMEPARALGLWRSTFGAVKIEADDSKGGLNTGAVQGVWAYQRQGQEVIGYFSGNLRGNVLDFRWQEPNNPPLTGAGYLVFDPQGRQYAGRWWSDRRDRIGDWNGWRQAPAQQGGGQYQQQPGGFGGQAYGGNTPYGANGAYGGQNGAYGGQNYGYQQPQPYPPRQPQYPQQRPPQQGYPQQYPQQRPPQPQPYYPQRQPQPQPQPQPYYPQQPPPQQPAPQPQPYYP